ncbi:hypothetical protein HBZS_105030 [Helicobacter bizzozeronii CCUG 35545]|nr:hypothetical protein HBZS_105030 [Helicobacter bizzozeronii CCUG 35545]
MGNNLENLRQEKTQLETAAQQKEKELGEQITSLKTQMATLKGFEPYQELLKLAQEHPNLGLVANTPEDLLNEIYKAPKNLMKKVAESTLKSIKRKKQQMRQFGWTILNAFLSFCRIFLVCKGWLSKRAMHTTPQNSRCWANPIGKARLAKSSFRATK